MDDLTVLVVDDDHEIVNSVAIYLKNEGLNILKAYDGMEALEKLAENQVDLILLDIMMPKLDGIQATLKIREQRNIPIILVSAKSEDTDKIIGLNMGADDYITKPYNPLELIARVKSQLRRYTKLGNNVRDTHKDGLLLNGRLELNTKLKVCLLDGEEIKLTPTEYKILELLMENVDVVFSSEQIYEKVWKETFYNAENIVAVHIRRIREKIEINPKDPRYLKVVWGIGYKMQAQK